MLNIYQYSRANHITISEEILISLFSFRSGIRKEIKRTDQVDLQDINIPLFQLLHELRIQLSFEVPLHVP
jgi:hypothetical protein